MEMHTKHECVNGVYRKILVSGWWLVRFGAQGLGYRGTEKANENHHIVEHERVGVGRE